MRSAGFILAALLVAASVGRAQPPAVPGQPVPPPAAPPAAKADPKLDPHLAEWEKKMANVVNLRTEIALKRTDSVHKRDKEYTGVVLCMKPNFAVLRLDYAADKADYEAFICNGKSVFHYAGLEKTITEYKLQNAAAGADNLMLDFLGGMKAKDVKERFDVSLFKTDANYIYLDIKPRLGKDQREFQHLRLALYGPGAATAKFSYLPARVFLLKPNGDSELWSFTNPQLDLPGVKPENFQYVPVKGFELKQAPPQPVGGPAPKGPVPAGGAVRPGKP